jgi:hypothetical protein
MEGTGMPACVMCTDATPRVAATPGLEAMPTVGCFVPGYLLIVPRAHARSYGQLDAATLDEAEGLIAALSARLAAVYDMPVLGFEYGINMPGERRIEHAHWHLLPSPAPLREWLDRRLPGHRVGALSDLPRDLGTSYIAVRDQLGDLTVYLAPQLGKQRIRLRQVVAELDPQVEATTWDWASHGYPELARQTIADLTLLPAGSTVGASTSG